MATVALHQLREAIKRNEEIDVDERVIRLSGGAVSFERKTLTNFHSMRGRGNAYPLDAVYFQWKLRDMPFNDYVQECSRAGTSHVKPLDKRDLLAYLSGEISQCAGLVSESAPTETVVAAAEEDVTFGEPEPKKPRLGGIDHSISERRQPREQRSIDSVLLAPDWDFSTIREKLARSLSKAKQSKPPSASKAGGGAAPSRDHAQPAFDPRGDRYVNNADRFWRENMGTDFQQFGIDPTGSFSAAAKSAPARSGDTSSRPSNGSSRRPKEPLARPPPPRIERSSLSSSRKRQAPPELSELRPILIVPGPGTALMNVSNVKEFFENGHFVTEEMLRQRGVAPDFSGRIKAMRTPGGNCSGAEYLLVSNVGRLTETEWDRVVGVVCSGKSWQFKHWKWNKGNKIDIVNCLHHVQGFFFHYDDVAPDPTAASWAVKLIPISRGKRHTDLAAQRQFFEGIDTFIRRHSKRVRY